MTEVYKNESVAAAQQLYGELLVDYEHMTVSKHLTLLAKRLMESYHDRHPVAAFEINNYHPDWLGKAPDLIFEAALTLDDIRLTIAAQYGFRKWKNVEEQKITYSKPFEQALHALLNGDTVALKDLLAKHPELVDMKSCYGHQAQLIHYAGNNGVEMWRQQVPMNLAEVTKIILEAGADKSATIQVYGGEFTTLQLFTTSAHPYEAGIAEEVVALLD